MKELITFRKYLNEGVINEGVNLNDTLDTPEDVMKFVAGRDESDYIGEAEKILDDITDVEDSYLHGEMIWQNVGEFYDEDSFEFEHYKEEFWDVGKTLTKRDVIKELLQSAFSYDYYADEGRLDDFDSSDVPNDWEERQDAAYILMSQKAKDKYGIEGAY